MGRGIKTSIRELTELILTIADSDLTIKYEPEGQTFVTNRVGDPAAAEKDLGFKWRTDLEEGLKRLMQWRKTHIHEVVSQNKDTKR